MKRINPKTGNPFRRGETRDDGYRFQGYAGFVRKDGHFTEMWLSPEAFERASQYARDFMRNHQRQSAPRPRSPEEHRKRALGRYGLTLETFQAMLDAQDGGCKACGRESAATHHGTLHVDHCHQTGRIRGLLCHHCNTGLGFLESNGNTAEVLARLLEYITVQG